MFQEWKQNTCYKELDDTLSECWTMWLHLLVVASSMFQAACTCEGLGVRRVKDNW